MNILGIESSCDETAAAVVRDGRYILSNIIATQVEEHKLYGGVVPEIASRRHCEAITGVVEEALEKANLTLKEIDAIAVTYAPGLIGALLVGVNFAKGLSASTGIPLVPTHHLRAHIASNYLAHIDLKPPFLCVVISGGHSHLVNVKSYTEFKVIARTRDDAAGEAYDKVARTMGFPYPGGIEIDKASHNGIPSYKLPRPKFDDSDLDISFSGLKTAVINILHNAEQKGEVFNKNNMCASFQEAVCDILSDRMLKCAKLTGYRTIVLAGGVSANSGVRKRMEEECKKHNYKLYMPPLSLCGDNAAMVASQGYYEFLNGNTAGLDLNAIASLPIDEK